MTDNSPRHHHAQTTETEQQGADETVQCSKPMLRHKADSHRYQVTCNHHCQDDMTAGSNFRTFAFFNKKCILIYL